MTNLTRTILLSLLIIGTVAQSRSDSSNSPFVSGVTMQSGLTSGSKWIWEDRYSSSLLPEKDTVLEQLMRQELDLSDEIVRSIRHYRIIAEDMNQREWSGSTHPVNEVKNVSLAKKDVNEYRPALRSLRRALKGREYDLNQWLLDFGMANVIGNMIRLEPAYRSASKVTERQNIIRRRTDDISRGILRNPDIESEVNNWLSQREAKNEDIRKLELECLADRIQLRLMGADKAKKGDPRISDIGDRLLNKASRLKKARKLIRK